MSVERGDNYVGGYSKRYTQDKATAVSNPSVVQEVKPSENKRKFVKMLVIFFGVVIVAAMIIGGIYLLGGFEKSISDSKLLEGATLDLKENNSLSFGFGEEDHGIKIGFVGLDSVDLTISSDPINLRLRINEVKEVDIDGDGVADIIVKLVQIVDGKATIAVRRIQQNRCLENWRCTEWEVCEKGIQKRECVDLNECGGDFGKPPERKKCLEMESVDWTDTGDWSGSRLFGTVKEASENPERVEEQKENEGGDITEDLEDETGDIDLEENINSSSVDETDLNENLNEDTETESCTEDWDCTDWNECLEGNQTRTCTDLNNCGTTETKPPLSQNCVESISCNNNDLCDNNENVLYCIDCLQELDFFSDKTCESFFDCENDEIYSICVLGFCAKPVQELKDFINDNFNLPPNCQDISCSNCEKGYLVASFPSSGDLDLGYCVECTSNGFASCNSGYECYLGTCVESSDNSYEMH